MCRRLGLGGLKERVVVDRWLDVRDWFATDLVFTLPDGRPLNSWAVSRHFAELGQRAGLPTLGLNEARRRAALPERELVPRRR
ncbi:MAG: hypothetical protein B7C55_11410 [Actinomycetales bacterium mxb001]|nr:MAG: hypothetical protein B7C55_11410 [Actinomycetales bacterium mxb001]